MILRKRRARTKSIDIVVPPPDPRFSLRVLRKKEVLKEELYKPWYKIQNVEYATWHPELNTWTEHWQLLYDKVVKPRVCAWKFAQRYIQACKYFNRGTKSKQIHINFEDIPLMVEKEQDDFKKLDPYHLELKDLTVPRGDNLCTDCGLELSTVPICIEWAGLGCENPDCVLQHKEICQCETKIKSLTWKERLAKADNILKSELSSNEMKYHAEKAKLEACLAIQNNTPDPEPFSYRKSVKDAIIERELKSAKRYKEWLLKHAEQECIWFLKNPEFVIIKKTNINVDWYWQTPSPNLSLEKKKEILEFWNKKHNNVI